MISKTPLASRKRVRRLFLFPQPPLSRSNYPSTPATAAGSKTYILRSTLDATIIEQAASSDERLLEEELADGPDNDDDDDDMPHNYGSIIAWSTADQLAALGLLHIILALILVNGRAISECASLRYLLDLC